MKEIEEVLSEEKKRVDAVKAPAGFEARLRGALDEKINRKPRRTYPYFKLAAVAVIFFMLAGYNYNAFAYYGKKLFGFDDVISGTMKDLNEKGMGQVVDQRTTLFDGTELVIDGIMTDENQLVMYYTLSNPQGLEDTLSDLFSPGKITGFLTNAHVESGVAKLNDEGTELKGTGHFEPVNPFARKLTLHFDQGPENKEVQITFPYEPNKAMQTQIKQSIKKTVAVDNGTLTFKTITATPTTTVIKGTMDVPAFDRIHYGFTGVELMANGRFMDQLGSGVETSMSGSKFELRFDALPEKLESLELVVKDFIGYKKLDEQIPLAEGRFSLGGNELWIQDISVTERGVEVTFATDSNLLLDGVKIESGNKQTELKTTINQTEEKQEDGRILNKRTMVFDTKSEPEYLLIEGIHYVKQYNKKVDIPAR
ncbi:DUF4179 domain-containing protein [Mesobacillus thioparans]|uniref:DUF4179 domain-containing protein n=1 Tax=Mesobacillus thioparans TaxID=370439 RepID=UPI0039EFE9DD